MPREVYSLKLTDAEVERIDRAAAKLRESRSEFMRAASVRRAESVLEGSDVVLASVNRKEDEGGQGDQKSGP